MVEERIKYDPTWRALFFPEKDPPVWDFSVNWECDQICAELSRRAYVRFERRDKARLYRELDDAGFIARACFHNGLWGAQAIGAVAPDGTSFVAFRGTQITSIKDIIADIAAIPVRRTGKGRVHYGFWRTYRSLEDVINGWLETQPKARLVITGHSLGAAMATVMAALHPEAELVTFGSPRVGNRAFLDQFAGRKVRRYADCTDSVVGLPPPLGYGHLDALAYIDHQGNLSVPAPDEAAQRRDQREGRRVYRRHHSWRLRNAPTRSLADHAVINYISAVLRRRQGP